MAGTNVAGPGIRKIEVESKIYRADGTLKESETHTTEITDEQYNQLKKDGIIND